MARTHASAHSTSTRVRRKRGRGRPKRNEDLGPTPETAAKLEADVLRVLMEADQITPDQEAAGRELHAMWRALRRGMLPQLRFGQSGRAPGRKQARSPFARMNEAEAEIWTVRYKPWADAEAKAVVARVPHLSRLELTRRVIENNTAPTGLAHRHGLQTDVIIDELCKSLDSYCILRRAK